MKTALETVIKDVMMSIYSPFWFALILAFLFMYFYMEWEKKGFQATVRAWRERFQREKQYRIIFWLAFYTAIMMSQVFSCSSIWINPTAEVLDGWWIYDKKGELTSDAIVNLLLYIPFIYLLLCAGKEKFFQKITFLEVFRKAFVFTFFCSVLTEFIQLMLRLQYVRVSDVVYNVIGGVLGGILFFLIHGGF